MATVMREIVPKVLSERLRRVARRIPYESGNYPYVTARVRAKKAALLTEATYTRMLQMETTEIVRLLGEGAYKSEVLALAPRMAGVDLIEAATSRNMAAIFTQILVFSEGELRSMIGWYLDRFDVQNIKTIVRGRLFGASAAEIQDDLVAAGSMRESFLRELIELPSLDEVFDRLDGTIYAKALEGIAYRPSEVKKWNRWEDLVTTLYYQSLLEVIPERSEGTRLMREWVRREVDIVNLKTLLRLWAQKATLPSDAFIEGGLELKTKALVEMLAMDAPALAARLGEYRLTEELAGRLKDLQALGVGQLVRSVEKLHLLSAGRHAHVNPLSVLPILDYIVRKEREVQNLRIIARGKESGLGSDVIRDLLVV